ncbi:MAG: phosphoribosylamine--glycine ligase [Parcubacteria group bacterium]|nr:phosphoribosylamine--glycine ligase [Parcubacteria group bacterium]
MRILVIGKGAREHAICWLIQKQRPECDLYCAPGSDGISQVARVLPQFRLDIPFSRLTELWVEIGKLRDWALRQEIDLVIVGPEDPLAAGIVDSFQAVGLLVFGPTMAAARLETDKGFAKGLMREIGVPTAPYELVENPNPAAVRRVVRRFWDAGLVAVVKPSGLTGGKGVFPAATDEALEHAITKLLLERVHGGEAVHSIVVEKFMSGEEASLFAICDGEEFATLIPAQDHKAVGEGDTGLNTGGMGAYAPAPVMTPALVAEVGELIIHPVLAEMRRRGTPYRGVLYVGLMITQDGPKVVEFNCRFGDPEAQVVLPLLESDLAGLCLAAARGWLCEFGPLELDLDRAAACVVMASGGYPGAYQKGKPISGLGEFGTWGDLMAFHAGTSLRDETWVTDGGRVLGITALADSIPSAVQRAYEGVARVSFAGEYHRPDIGHRALARLGVAAE